MLLGMFVDTYVKNRTLSHELKEELLLCLMALVKDRSSEECSNDEQWTMMMDRGGLWHVKETTYALLLSIEEEI